VRQRTADINRNVLSALQAMGTCTLDEIAQHHSFVLLHPSREELARAVNDMLVYGYIENPIPGDSEYYKLTEKGMRQLNRDGVKLDPAIWGRAAAL
jgi:hypothetical protein